MIYVIENINDPYAKFVDDDPVRPHIPKYEKFGPNRKVIALLDDSTVKSLVCIKLCSIIPTSESELLSNNSSEVSNAIFYTIWSYKPGAGQLLLRESVNFLKEQFFFIKRFVTLSPPTETARRFHIRNGAVVLRVNADTVNYEYILT